MFERFTDQARQVIVLAQEEARNFKHPYIGTEHILLGLLREEERRPGDQAPLRSLGITLAAARERVWRLVRPGDEDRGGQMPFTPRAKKVLELALREALILDHSWIGPEHILLGIVHENEGMASRILLDFDADSLRVRNEVIRTLDAGPEQQRIPRIALAGPKQAPIDTAWLAGLFDVLPILASEIRQSLGREFDIGDLLLAIGCARDTVGGRALSELGMDLDALCETLERIRRGLAQEPVQPGQISDVQSQREMLGEFRRRLGLPEEGS